MYSSCMQMRRRQRRRRGNSDSKCAARSIRFTYIEICMPAHEQGGLKGRGGGCVKCMARGSIVECGEGGREEGRDVLGVGCSISSSHTYSNLHAHSTGDKHH